MSGGVPRAKDGTLAIMIGGNAGAVQAVKPVLSKMGGKLFEVGGLGCGHAMKALNNFLAGTSFAAASEAVRVGRTFGLDPAVMIDVINVSTGRSFPTDLVMKQHVLSGTFATGFALGLLAKDVGIAADLASQVGADAPIVRMISDLWAEARDANRSRAGSQPRGRVLGPEVRSALRRQHVVHVDVGGQLPAVGEQIVDHARSRRSPAGRCCSIAISSSFGRDELVPLMGAARQPAQHVFGADDREREALQRAVERRRDHQPAGLHHRGAACDEQRHIGDVLDHLHGQHDVEALAGARPAPRRW